MTKFLLCSKLIKLIKLFFLDPLAKNKPMYSQRKLGMHSTPYNFQNNITDLCLREGERGATPPLQQAKIYRNSRILVIQPKNHKKMKMTKLSFAQNQYQIYKIGEMFPLVLSSITQRSVANSEYHIALSSPVGKLLIGSQTLGYGIYPKPNGVLPIIQCFRSNQQFAHRTTEHYVILTISH